MAPRRTRIICTLGPATASLAAVRQLIAAGMDVARVNFSHGDEASHRAAVATLRSAARAAGRHVALLQDLQGPKLRTGLLRTAPVRLRRGEPITLTSRPVTGDESTIAVSHAGLIRSLAPEARVLIADGEIELRVRSVNGRDALCSVTRGGLLGERKGITVPSAALRLPALTEKDNADLALGAELGFDYVALSFVRSGADVQACRKAMQALRYRAPIVAKLERPQGLQHLATILARADAVMVARGDLGVELSLAEVPAVQKDVIERANRAGVPVITATEMLESMVTSNRPTRAEASDIANAIWDGTDAVMLSAETSVGAHPIEAVRAMAMICRAAEEHSAYQRLRQKWVDPGSIGNAIANAAAAVASEVDAAAIVAFTETGGTALRVSKARPLVPVIAASPHPATLRRTALYAGVVAQQVAYGTSTDELLESAGGVAVASGLASRRDRVVVVAGVASQPGQTNLLKVVTI